jgi:hypothetical protein
MTARVGQGDRRAGEKWVRQGTRDRAARAGQQQRTVGLGEKGQCGRKNYSMDRTAGIGHRERIARTGQSGQDSQSSTARTGQDGQNRTARKAQEGRKDEGCWDSVNHLVTKGLT